MKKKRFSPAGKRHISCSSNYSQGVPVSVGVTVKPKRFLPFLFLRSKDLPRLGTRSRSPVLAFCLLLTPSCLLLLTSCKDIGIPPDRIIPDTTSHGPDTTSHNFIWTIDTLGDGSGGYLYGVAIINDPIGLAVIQRLYGKLL